MPAYNRGAYGAGLYSHGIFLTWQWVGSVAETVSADGARAESVSLDGARSESLGAAR